MIDASPMIAAPCAPPPHCDSVWTNGIIINTGVTPGGWDTGVTRQEGASTQSVIRGGSVTQHKTIPLKQEYLQSTLCRAYPPLYGNIHMIIKIVILLTLLRCDFVRQLGTYNQLKWSLSCERLRLTDLVNILIVPLSLPLSCEHSSLFTVVFSF